MQNMTLSNDNKLRLRCGYMIMYIHVMWMFYNIMYMYVHRQQTQVATSFKGSVKTCPFMANVTQSEPYTPNLHVHVY